MKGVFKSANAVERPSKMRMKNSHCAKQCGDNW